MILLDPIRYVFVRRALSSKQAELFFPGNEEVRRINAELTELQMSNSQGGATIQTTGLLSGYTGGTMMDYASFAAPSVSYARSASSRQLVGDTVERKTAYTPPRSITIDNKYQGAVAIGIWPGYAIQVCKPDGSCRVEVGPKKVLLEYNEDLTRLSLSTGKPKSTDSLFQTVYLKISGNQVTDIIRPDTKDGVGMEFKIILQVRFEGDPTKWFVVDNYVKQITDHVRSIVRAAVKRYSIVEVMQDPSKIIRDAILGAKEGDKPRTGLRFEINGAVVYDVEVLDAKVLNSQVAAMLDVAQKELVQGMIQVIKKQQEVQAAKEIQVGERAIVEEIEKTNALRHQTELAKIERKLKADLAQNEITLSLEKRNEDHNTDILTIRRNNTEQELTIDRSRHEFQVAKQKAIDSLAIALLSAQTEAIKERMTAISPEFVAAFQAGADRDALVKIAEQMGIAAYLKDRSVGSLVDQFLDGTTLKGAISKLTIGRREAQQVGSGAETSGVE